MNHLETTFFYILSPLTVMGAVFVVISRKPTYSVLALAFAMLTLSGLFILLHAYFVAIIQILIYAGAILVLFLFIILLIGLEPKKETQSFLSLTHLLPLFLVFAFLLEAGVILFAAQQIGISQTTIPGTVEHVADQLFGPYLLPFELVSGVLLVGIFGVVNLTQKEP